MSDVHFPAPSRSDDGRLIYMSHITADNSVTDRAVRKWIERGVFPPPDTNLHGRNAWRLETYRAWQADVMAGTFKKIRCPIPTRDATTA
jgi:hypothetical protein